MMEEILMKAAWLLMAWLVIAVGVNAQYQDKGLVGDFTRSPTEHIIVQIDQPFVVREVRGTIRFAGHDPLSDVLFEVQGPGAITEIKHATSDKHGRFRISSLPTGIYRFKTTLDGFQSIMGSIVISKKAAKRNEINLEMRVGV